MLFSFLPATAFLSLLIWMSQAAYRPIVIAHRGASGERPEHTIAAYDLAIDQGADFIEPDIVITKDGVLIARHENELSDTTDVAAHPEFAARKTSKTIDGMRVTGWFSEDFTLAEIKTLRVKERLPKIRPGNVRFDGQFAIPTLQEVIDLVKRKSAQTGRVIGIYPETKHPSYFDSLGLSMEEPLVRTLHDNGYRGANAPVFIQSFEVGNLLELRKMTDLPLIQLLNDVGKPYDFVLKKDPRTYADLIQPDALRKIAQYAQGIGPNKNMVVPRDGTGKLQSPTRLLEDARRAGLKVHIWTLRNEDYFLPKDFKGDPKAEYRLFYNLRVDGVFTDFPAVGVAVRNEGAIER
jgi:glycerophosphoryl diester phosphodiesterase